MKPVSNALKLETQGLVNEHKAFKVSQSRRMFEILSSTIYKDKPLAVLREYGCNAWDAHIAAGTDDRPFDVHLPNSFEPYFSIRDYGTGLSHEDVLEIYTTYGLSTKTNENESVGMLGLGSKSAFAYNDQFTITSIFGGIERIYSAFLDSDGIPTITMINEEPSEEHNGLEIHIPVKSEDFSTFAARAVDVFFRFPVLPNVTGNVIDLQQVEYTLVKEYFKLRDDYSGNCVAVQGTVAYPISSRAFSEGLLTDEQRQFLSNVPIDFIFPIGTLDIAASREDLNYNRSTQDAIIEAMNRALEELPKQFDDLLSNCKTLWEAKIFYNEWMSKQKYVVKTILKASKKEIFWKDVKMTDEMSIQIELFDMGEKQNPAHPDDPTQLIPDMKFWKAQIQVWDHHELQPKSKYGAPGFCNSGHIAVNPNTLILFVDKRFKAPTRSMRELFKNRAYRNDGKIYVIRNYTEEEFDKICMMLDGIPPEQVQFLSEYKEPMSPKEKAQIKKFFQARGFRSYGPELHEVERDVSLGGKYMLLYNGTLMGVEDKSTDSRYARLLYAMESFRPTEDLDLFFVNYSHKSVGDQPGWVNYHDELKARVLDIVSDKKLREAYGFFAALKYSRRYDQDPFSSYLKFVDKNADSVPKSLKFPYELAKKYSDVINKKFGNDMHVRGHFDKVDTFRDLTYYAAGVYNTPIWDYEKVIEPKYIAKKLHKMARRAPLFMKLLGFVGNYRSQLKDQDVIDYINQYAK